MFPHEVSFIFISSFRVYATKLTGTFGRGKVDRILIFFNNVYVRLCVCARVCVPLEARGMYPWDLEL